MNPSPISLPLALTLILAPLWLLGCANQPKSTPAPVVQPNQTTSAATTQPAPSHSATTPEPVASKAPILAITVAPEPFGGIIPAAIPLDDSNLANQIKQAQSALRKVVVLLPDRPSLAEVNRDIAKGIMAAHQQQPHNPHLQLIFVHDSLSGEALMQKAQAYAPDWIIGPLTKADIQSVQSLAGAQHILLNRLDTPTAALQIGLPAEDEIDQLLAHFQPQQGQLLVISSNDASEQRLVNYLSNSAQAKQLVTIQVTVEKQNADLRPWLISEGGIQSSQDRIKRMTQLVRADLSDSNLQARQDIQAVIFLGNAKQLRSIMPSLTYYRVEWPIYATSHLLPSKNSETFHETELNGVTVLAPPYLLTPQLPSSPFEALGWDSYLLLANPQALGKPTQTGKLVNQNNQLRRQLNWTHIKEGRLTTPKP